MNDTGLDDYITRVEKQISALVEMGLERGYIRPQDIARLYRDGVGPSDAAESLVMGLPAPYDSAMSMGPDE